jgi:hypothetical protein
MSKRREFVDKAQSAEEYAGKTKEEANKAAWLRIAAGYHDLASRQEEESSPQSQ